MILTLLAVLQLSVPQDTLPKLTLTQALDRATQLDPDYVRALGQVRNAEWGRRAALAVFVLPSVTLNLNLTKYSAAFFNIGTGTLQSTSATFNATASYELLSLRKFADLSRTRAELENAEAGTLQARFSAALLTEAAFYDVLAGRELNRLAGERVRRATEEFQVARARVQSGAAVQTDSLGLALELLRARVDSLRQASTLRVAQLELGRRVGMPGPVDAAETDSASLPDLPLGQDEAVSLALEQGPQYRAARAAERAAAAALRVRMSDYLPVLSLTGAHSRFDTKLFPSARAVSSLAVGVSFSLWNNGQREIAASQARVTRDVARAIREDLERGARADVTQAYEAYTTARATEDLTRTALVVARENYRVQDARYRGGATTILDLLSSQVALSQAEADLVQARFAARLALSGLEAIVGKRLFPNRALP